MRSPTARTLDSEVKTVGRPTHAREIAGAVVLVAGGALVGALTLAGFRPYENLCVLGGIALVAWLVDGSSQRYVGPGAVAFAAGLGITIGKNAGVNPYEHSLVYGGFGLALLLLSVVNPRAVRASGAFLVYTAATVAIAAWVVSFELGWELAVILAVWGIFELIRFRSGQHRDAGHTTKSLPVPEREFAGRGAP